MELKVYNQSGKESKAVKLPESVFGVKWNADLVHQVVTSLLSSKRSGNAHAKTRGEVRGGGKKPWQQKGTGRARHGSTRSPIWVGGGTTHGPRNDKNYFRKVNAKMLSKALACVLSKKVQDEEILFVDKIELTEKKTALASNVISSLSGIKGASRLKGGVASSFMIIPGNDLGIKRSFRNLNRLIVGEARNFNVIDALNNKFLIIVDPEKSLKTIESRIK